MVAALIYAIGDMSGAHSNPVVSFAFALRRLFPWRSACQTQARAPDGRSAVDANSQPDDLVAARSFRLSEPHVSEGECREDSAVPFELGTPRRDRGMEWDPGAAGD